MHPYFDPFHRSKLPEDNPKQAQENQNVKLPKSHDAPSYIYTFVTDHLVTYYARIPFDVHVKGIFTKSVQKSLVWIP